MTVPQTWIPSGGSTDIFAGTVYAGQIAATYVLGCKLLRRRLGAGSALAPVVAGSLLIALFFVAAAVCFTFGGLGGAMLIEMV